MENLEIKIGDQKFNLGVGKEVKINENMSIKLLNFIDNNHKIHSWYGREVAEIKYKDYIFIISAIGNIHVNLRGEDNRIIESVKDKNNSGQFYNVFKNIIKSDHEIIEMIRENKIEIKQNNWFEVFISDKSKKSDGMHEVIDADFLDEAIVEIANEKLLEEWISYVEEAF